MNRELLHKKVFKGSPKSLGFSTDDLYFVGLVCSFGESKNLQGALDNCEDNLPCHCLFNAEIEVRKSDDVVYVCAIGDGVNL